ncbi:ATP-binding protein [Rossellomorea marisflavi]|uniref:ATP-binding protein n=1 Tax=Rossellomorea marisflavi TaxID=189381 RepID=UPI00203BA8B8|nr:ATP-binding protein [Rossellomorea marisflavi]MCM2607136.1 ATP-binding protein [Rossellomorea marisflavi]
MKVREKNNPTKIEFDPRVIYESLGSKIIESNSIAIAEQIKNAKDAGAENIIVDFSNINNDLIEIRDDGKGMTLDDVKENWFFVGTNNKNFQAGKLGGKGIGRFSIFKIANIIEIHTISNGKKCSFRLDKNDLEQNESLSELSIDIVEEDTKDENGTSIFLSDLSKLNLLEIQEELENLNLPFEKKCFTLEFPKSYTLNFLEPKNAVQDAPFFAEVEFEGDKIIKYDFTCTYSNQKVYSNNDSSNIQSKIDSKLLTENIGRTRVYIYNFYFDRKLKNISNQRKTEIENQFLSAYQGISVYRNGFKIYGHGIEDWLKLAEKRLMKPGENIDNKLTFGYILLDQYHSLGLEEKTNREGFFRSDETKYFKAIMNLIITEFGQDRKKAISDIKKFINTNIKEDESKGHQKESELGDKQNTESKDTKNEDNGYQNGNKGPINGNSKGNKSGGPDTQGRDAQGNQNEYQEPQDEENQEDQDQNQESQNRGAEGNRDGNDQEPKNRFTYNKRIGYFNESIKNNIKSDKVKDLVNEITSIDITRYTFATSFLLRSLVEVTMNEYLKVNFNSIKSNFNFYVLDQDKNIKQKIIHSKTGDVTLKDIPISKKINDFRTYLNNTANWDKRSLKHLSELSKLIDDINLAIHWSEKRVAIDKLQTNWSNSKFFLEYLCSKI